jgi:alpha-tubulin suppressor-like RCC1 family protein
MRGRSRSWQLGPVFVVCNLVSACDASPPKAVAGLEIVVSASDLEAPTDFDDIRLQIAESSGNTTQSLWNQDYLLPQQATLPGTFTLFAGQSPMEVLITVTAYAGGPGGAPVVQRVAQVQVPTDRMALLYMVLAKVCEGQVAVTGAEGEPVSTCVVANESCQPSTGMCGPNEINGNTLPTYMPGESLDAAPDGAVLIAVTENESGAAPSGEPDAALETGPRDASPDSGTSRTEATDATISGSRDAAPESSGSSSGSSVSGSGSSGSSSGSSVSGSGSSGAGSGASSGSGSGSGSTTGSSSGAETEGGALSEGGVIAEDGSPSDAAELTGATAISVGSHSACALLSGGTVQCWGDNFYGELGNGTSMNDRSTPVPVTGLTDAIAVSNGYQATCAVLSGGTAECWGQNSAGELGNGQYENASTPVAVTGLTGVTAVSFASSSVFACAVVSANTVSCWGDNTYGELGNGTTTSWPTPVAVTGITGATAVSGGDAFACALLSGGTVQCWGDDAYGQLGNGTTTGLDACNGGNVACSLTPVPVSGLTGATAVTLGEDAACALLMGGTVECWGHNAYGQLGNGTMTDSSTPVTVSGLTGATAVSAGNGFACALLSGGTVQCWGDNNSSNLGDGTYNNAVTPVTVTGVMSAMAVSAGSASACALLSGGTVKCWGYSGYGELGDGTMAGTLTPVTVQ